MGRILALTGATLLLALSAPGALALPYMGELEIRTGALEPIAVNGGGDGVSSPSTASLGVGASLTATTTRPITAMSAGGMTTFPAFPIVAFTLSDAAGLTQGTFATGAGPGGGFGGDVPLQGNFRWNIKQAAFITVPLSPVGVEGATTSFEFMLGVNVTIAAGGWTTGIAQVTGTFGGQAGVVIGQTTGADLRTPGGAGSLALVAPTLVITNVSGFENVPLLSRLTLTYVPEPGTLLLVSAGVAALGFMHQRRSPTRS